MKDLIFVHIPKTGGMSVRRALIDGGYDPFFYGRGADKTTPSDFVAALQTESVRVIAAHLDERSPDVTWLRGSTRRLATVLRDPVARTYSHYCYSKHKGSGNLRKAAARGLAHFVDVMPEDHQARTLTAMGWGSSPGDLYTGALLTLQLFDVVGVTEDLDNFIKWGLQIGHLGDRAPHENLGPRNDVDPLTDEIRVRILQKSRADRALWRAAQRIAPRNPHDA